MIFSAVNASTNPRWREMPDNLAELRKDIKEFSHQYQNILIDYQHEGGNRSALLILNPIPCDEDSLFYISPFAGYPEVYDYVMREIKNDHMVHSDSKDMNLHQFFMSRIYVGFKIDDGKLVFSGVYHLDKEKTDFDTVSAVVLATPTG